MSVFEALLPRFHDTSCNLQIRKTITIRTILYSAIFLKTITLLHKKTFLLQFPSKSLKDLKKICQDLNSQFLKLCLKKKVLSKYWAMSDICGCGCCQGCCYGLPVLQRMFTWWSSHSCSHYFGQGFRIN